MTVPRICVLTGSRAEYGILRPVLFELSRREAIRLELLVTGMHLMPEFGHTIDRIVEEGYPIREEVEILLGGDTPASMARALGRGVDRFAQSFEADPPGAVLVYGDRIEALAGAIAAAYLYVPVIHMHGGDSAAGYDIDDANRHAITKFAHVHLPATERHAERIRRMGEAPDRIVVVGSPALDSIRARDYTRPERLREHLDLPFDRARLVVVQHPVTSEAMEAADQIAASAEAVRRLGLPTVWIYPNADSGSAAIVRALDGVEQLPHVAVRRSVPHRDFLGLLGAADLMLGNSSSALIEAPSFGLPAVNIGTRQADRERAANVVDVDHDADRILEAVTRILEDGELRQRLRHIENPYGDGHTAPRVADAVEWVLADPRRFLVKRWVD